MTDKGVSMDEITMLALVLKEPNNIFKIKKDNFISAMACNIFQAIDFVIRNNISLTSHNVYTEAIKQDQSINEGSVQGVFDKVEEVNNKDFAYYRKKLKEDKVAMYIQGDLLNESIKESFLGLDGIKRLIKEMQDQLVTVDDDEPLIYNLSEMFKKYSEEIYERDKNKNFYDTGCPHLNSRLIFGFVPKRITTIIGASGIGKSTYALYMVNCQINKRLPSLYISLEMDLISTMDRLIAQRRKIPISHFLPGGEDSSIPQHVYDKIEEERRILCRKGIPFRFVEKPGLTLDEIEFIIKSTKKEVKSNSLICTIDLITMIRDFNATTQKAVDYENSMNILHEIAKRNNVHIVGVVQCRRPSDRVRVTNLEDLDRGMFRPRIEEIKNSSAFEERSRIIISTYRKKHYALRLFPNDPETPQMDDVMEVDILKNNLGPLARLQYKFDGSTAYLCRIKDEEN